MENEFLKAPVAPSSTSINQCSSNEESQTQAAFYTATKEYYDLLKLKNTSTPNTFLRQTFEAHEILDLSPEPILETRHTPLQKQYGSVKSTLVTVTTENTNITSGRHHEIIEIDISDEEEKEDSPSVPVPTNSTFRLPQSISRSKFRIPRSQIGGFQSQLSIPQAEITKYKSLERDFKVVVELLGITQKQNKKLRRGTNLSGFGITTKKRRSGQNFPRSKALSDQILDSVIQHLRILPDTVSKQTDVPSKPSAGSSNESSMKQECGCLCFCSKSNSSAKVTNEFVNILPISDSSWKELQRTYRNEFRDMGARASAEKRDKGTTPVLDFGPESNENSESPIVDLQMSGNSNLGFSSSQGDSGIASSSESSSCNRSSGDAPYKAQLNLVSQTISIVDENVSQEQEKPAVNPKMRNKLKELGKIISRHETSEKTLQKSSEFESQSLLSNSQRRPLSHRPAVPVFNRNANSWDTRKSRLEQSPSYKTLWNIKPRHSYL